ncbi:MAG: oligosaccharide flippase family protein [Betaproteobacteria bacterium]
MSGAARAIASQGLKLRALSLGAVKAFDHALQFLLPVLLVRCLDAASFGEYRLLWLVVGTVMALAVLNMPGSLYFFLPRAGAAQKRLYVQQTLAYLGVAGLLCALVVSPLNPWLPEAVKPLTKYGAVVPAFIALWVTSALLDYTPTVEERISWQAYATMAIAVVRVLLLGAAAWFTGDLMIMLWLLVATVLLKLALLFAYIQRYHGLGRPWFDRALFAGQLRYAVPFGISSAFYSLRSQADQWVAASLFALQSFAAFSIAAILGQVVNIFRTSVLEAFLPSMSRMEAAGDVKSLLDMNARANVMVGTLLYPLLGFSFAFAEDIVSFVYTAAYVEAAPVMRVYVVALVLMVIEVGSIILLLRQGPFTLGVNLFALALSVAVSWLAASHVGLAGAAAGSVVALYIDRAITLRRIAAQTGVPVARLQHWGSLAWLLVVTALASLIARLAVDTWAGALPLLARIAIGGAILSAIYCGAVLVRRRA